MRLRSLLITLSMLYVIFPSTAKEANADPLFIVALGGASVEAFFLGEYGQVFTTPYVADALDEALGYDACFLRLEQCAIQEIFWSGDLKDGSVVDYTSNVKAVLEKVKSDYPEREIVIVAHSWGSVVAYRVLKELEDDGWGQGAVALVVSLGSPLGSQCAKFIRSELEKGAPEVSELAIIGDPALKKPDILSRWVNLWTENDKVSGAIAFAKNIEITYGSVADINCTRSSALVHLFTLKAAHQAYYDLFLGYVIDVIEGAIRQDIPEEDECEEIYTAAQPVPGGYGAAYNVLSQEKELLVETTCYGATVRLSAGSGLATQYIYRYGYEWTGIWRQLELWGPTIEGVDDWFVGNAFAKLNRTPGELAPDNFTVAYVCTWTGRECSGPQL